MSIFLLCDGADCFNSENEGVYNVSNSLDEYLQKHHSFSIDSSASDLCDNCIENINKNYEEKYPLIIKDEFDDLVISENFKEIN